MEKIAAEHHDYGPASSVAATSANTRRGSRAATRATVGECRCRGCDQFDILPSCHGMLCEYQPEYDSIFVRLSHRRRVDREIGTKARANGDIAAFGDHYDGDALLLWQGFVRQHDKEEYRHPFHRSDEESQGRVTLDVTQASKEAELTEVQECFLDNSGSSTSALEMESFEDFIRLNRVKRKHFQGIASNLKVTVVILPNGQGDVLKSGSSSTPRSTKSLLPSLPVATGGFWFLSARDHSGYLQPKARGRTIKLTILRCVFPFLVRML